MLALLLLFCQFALPFPVSSLRAEELPTTDSGEKVAQGHPEAGDTEGVASYYAKRYNGRKTCSGARYNPEKLTAAHPGLPFGSRVKVINLANDREVTVTVNDRCRERSFPFIDLSREAAKKLGFLGKGTAKVKIVLLDDDTTPHSSANFVSASSVSSTD
jgi:rare lipoprotein A